MKPERALALAAAQLHRWAETICATHVRVSIVVTESVVSVTLVPCEPSDAPPWDEEAISPYGTEWEATGDDDAAYGVSRDPETLELFEAADRSEAHQS